MAVYAVKVAGRWWIAQKAKGRDFSLERLDAEVWSEMGTTAFLGYVGSEDRAVELEATR